MGLSVLLFSINYTKRDQKEGLVILLGKIQKDVTESAFELDLKE